MSAPIVNTLRKYRDVVAKSKFLRFGLPMMLLIVGGSFGLKEFAILRYETQYLRRKIDPETEERLGLKKKKGKVTLEGEYERLAEQDIDTWTNIRGPRPWEDSKEVQDELRKEQKGQNTKS
ncbi:cytochrome c oxidase assembly protein COX16 homolog, mitochondrial-like [Glandiceps talaboti]